ncbi:MAG: hypothetical protein Q9O62_11995 [Ardenticatenia bacterium]|nr:hypothetical protein [Ardenticatenia bacterium]
MDNATAHYVRLAVIHTAHSLTAAGMPVPGMTIWTTTWTTWALVVIRGAIIRHRVEQHHAPRRRPVTPQTSPWPRMGFEEVRTPACTRVQGERKGISLEITIMVPRSIMVPPNVRSRTRWPLVLVRPLVLVMSVSRGSQPNLATVDHKASPPRRVLQQVALGRLGADVQLKGRFLDHRDHLFNPAGRHNQLGDQLTKGRFSPPIERHKVNVLERHQLFSVHVAPCPER